MVSNIVFTKNRPLQLQAYLESLYKYFPEQIIKTYIIYKVELFSEQYEALFKKFSDCVVIKESDFHSDFLKVFNQLDTKYILFGIDDVVYFDSVDFEVIDIAFAKFPEDIFGFSLRFGPKNIEDANDPVSEAAVTGQTVYSLNWKDGRTPGTRYPFELCATVYTTALVKKILNSAMNGSLLIKKLFSPGSAVVNLLGKIVSKHKILRSFGYFYNPNSLESWICRWCQNHNEQLPSSIYFQKLCASAIQVNMVNISTRKKVEEFTEHSIRTLNEKYKNGFRLDIDFVAKNKPKSNHSGKEYFRLVKT